MTHTPPIPMTPEVVTVLYWWIGFQFLFWLSTRFGVPKRYFFKWNSLLALIGGAIGATGFYLLIFLFVLGHFFDFPKDGSALWYTALPFIVFVLPLMFYASIQILKSKGRWPI